MSYPSELGTMDRHKHYVMFFINKQARSKIDFGTGAVDTEANTSTEGTTLSIKRVNTKTCTGNCTVYASKRFKCHIVQTMANKKLVPLLLVY